MPDIRIDRLAFGCIERITTISPIGGSSKDQFVSGNKGYGYPTVCIDFKNISGKNIVKVVFEIASYDQLDNRLNTVRLETDKIVTTGSYSLDNLWLKALPNSVNLYSISINSIEIYYENENKPKIIQSYDVDGVKETNALLKSSVSSASCKEVIVAFIVIIIVSYIISNVFCN